MSSIFSPFSKPAKRSFVFLVASLASVCSLAQQGTIVAAVAPPATPTAKTSAANTLKIGVIGPFTGPSSDFGLPMFNGIQLAVDEINKVGGYLGRPLEIVVKDDQSNPDTGLKLSQELVDEKVVATLGFCNTGVAAKSLETFQTAKIPLVIPCATGSPLTSKYPAAESYIFRNSAKGGIQIPFVIDDILKRGWDKVAVFADTTGYGEAGFQDIVKSLEAKNLKPVYVARFPVGVKDLSEELKAARAAGANVVFGMTVGPEHAAIARSRQAIGWNVPMASDWSLSYTSFIDLSKEAGEGALMAQTFIGEPSNERRASFLSAYARKFNVKKVPVPVAAAQGYDAVYILLYSLLGIRDGNLNGPAVKAALENKNRVYYGVVSTYERPFSKEDKDAVTPNMLFMGVVRNGAVTFAYPEDAKRNLFVQRKQ